MQGGERVNSVTEGEKTARRRDATIRYSYSEMIDTAACKRHGIHPYPSEVVESSQCELLTVTSQHLSVEYVARHPAGSTPRQDTMHRTHRDYLGKADNRNPQIYDPGAVLMIHIFLSHFVSHASRSLPVTMFRHVMQPCYDMHKNGPDRPTEQTRLIDHSLLVVALFGMTWTAVAVAVAVGVSA
jgi:hypothetical protein